MAGGTSCLSLTTTIIGVILAAISVAGIGGSLFLMIAKPLQVDRKGTDTPNYEDIGKLKYILFFTKFEY